MVISVMSPHTSGNGTTTTALLLALGLGNMKKKVLIGFMMTSIVLSAIGCGKNEVIDALGNTQRVETQAESDKEDDEELVVNQEKNKAKEQGEEKKEE